MNGLFDIIDHHSHLIFIHNSWSCFHIWISQENRAKEFVISFLYFIILEIFSEDKEFCLIQRSHLYSITISEIHSDYLISELCELFDRVDRFMSCP